jgi:2,3-bisphosphoglycerate-dependent phosphoglycerate mutase
VNGPLQGLNKAETAVKHGKVKIWRRVYDIPPPQMSTENPSLPENDPKYAHYERAILPLIERLKIQLIDFYLIGMIK